MANDRLYAPVTQLTGSTPVEWTRIAGGYARNEHWRVALADGRSVFIKAAGDEVRVDWLRAEHKVYASVNAPFLPRLIGWHDGGDHAALVLEDVGNGFSAPPWTPAKLASVADGLNELAASPPPAYLPRLADTVAAPADISWGAVAADPAPFLSLGLCSAAWLERRLPSLVAAVEQAPIDGDSLVHGDVRSDNVCFRDGRAVFVDWNFAMRANPALDVAVWLPTVALQGGPAPDDLYGDRPSDLPALIAGMYAAQAGLPPAGYHTPAIRALQRDQLAVALPWALRSLELEPVVA